MPAINQMPIKISGIPGTVGMIAPARPKTISATATISSKILIMEFMPQDAPTGNGSGIRAGRLVESLERHLRDVRVEQVAVSPCFSGRV